MPIKYEIYIPDRYLVNDEVCILTDEDYKSHIEAIINMLPNNLTGFSIRHEDGYYRYNNNLFCMKNSVLYFFSDSANIDLTYIVEYIKSALKQKEVLIVQNGVAKIW